MAVHPSYMPSAGAHKTFVQLLDQRTRKMVDDARPLPGIIQPISIPYIVHGGDPSTTATTTTTVASTSGLLPLTVGPLPPFLIDFPFQITGVALASASTVTTTDPTTGTATTTSGGAVTIDIGTAAIVPTTLPSGYVMSIFPQFFSITGASATTTETTDPTTGLTTTGFTITPGPNSPAMNGNIATIPVPYQQDLTLGPPSSAPLMPDDWLVQWPAATWIQYSILAVDGVMTDLTIHLRVLQLGRQ